MNKKERDILIALKTDVKYIRETVKDHNVKLDNIIVEQVKTTTNLKNHLKTHQRDLGIILAVAAIVAAIIVKIL